MNNENKTITRPNRFFHYNTQNKDFDINIKYFYQNIGRVAKDYIVPKFKLLANVALPFTANPLVGAVVLPTFILPLTNTDPVNR
jgi:hypothetical protein